MALRVGLVGCGGIMRAHWRGWSQLQQQCRVEIVALADPVAENRGRFKADSPDAAEFADFREMYEKVELDAVDICLPHHLHAAAILEAIQRGLHWLCEKPLCMTLEEAERIDTAMAARSDLVGMSAHNQVFMPAVAEAKRLLDQGLLGETFTIISQDCFLLGLPQAGSIPGTQPRSPIQPGSWRASRSTMGGGELIDTGYHPSYRLLFLAGAEPTVVAAVLGSHRHRHLEGEDSATVLVGFGDGTTGLIRTSWAMQLPYGHHQIHVIGRNGELFGSGRDLYFKPLRAAEPARYSLPEVDTFAAEVVHFVECIERQAEPIQTHKDGIAVLRLIRQAYKFAGAD